MQYTVRHCSLLTAKHCNVLPHTAPHYNTLQHTYTLQHTATHCNIFTVTHCNILQHTTAHCNTLQYIHCTLQHTATQALNIYRHLRLTAAALLHPDQVKRGGGGGSRMSAIMRTKHVTVLGRAVNLAEQLSSRMTSLQHTALNYAVARFKTAGLSGVRELDALLDTTRCTYRYVGCENMYRISIG